MVCSAWRTLTFYTDVPLAIVSARWTPRPDVVRALADPSLEDSGGFVVELEMARDSLVSENFALCVVRIRQAGR